MLYRRVVQLFHAQLADTYSKLEVSTPQAKRRYFQSSFEASEFSLKMLQLKRSNTYLLSSILHPFLSCLYSMFLLTEYSKSVGSYL